MSLWSGRFAESPAEVMWAFTVDVSDRRLLEVDVRGSLAHVAMLGSVGLVDAEERSVMSEGLEMIRREALEGSFVWLDTDEDVHSAVERRLGELVGDVAGKLHTGRSRNDQVALDLRLHLTDAVDDRIADLNAFIDVLTDKADEVGDRIVPSYTHMQQAQAVPFAHHLLAYAWMAMRDIDRFRDARRRIDVSPLGASGSGGSSLPIDPATSTAVLGMSAAFENSMDAVGSRDFVAEYVWCVAQTMNHLSRLSEELLLWSTSEFGWVTFSDAYTTGSSVMPHKKNADIAELVRGRTAGVIGDLAAIMALQKGLPMTYNRDLQEDKRTVFHADDTLAGSLAALSGLIASAAFSPPEPSSWVMALDLAEVLVKRGVPFREAHGVVGRLVMTLVASDRSLADLDGDELVAFDGRFEAGDVALIDPAVSVERRVSGGGGSPASVAAQLDVLGRRTR